MSLRFDITKCPVNPVEKYPDGKNEFGEDIWNPIFFHMALTSTLVGMYEITEDNWEEYFTRVHIWEKAFGTTLIINGKSANTPPEIVRDFIGLSVNATPLTKTQFRKKVMDNLEREARYEAETHIKGLKVVGRVGK